MAEQKLSKSASLLIDVFEDTHESHDEEKTITVNPVVSEVASWYERLRNVMDYRADEVILRAAIERILKRRILILGGSGEKTAEPLVRELIWARYFPDSTIPEAIIKQVASSIDLHLRLRDDILRIHSLSERTVDEWIYNLMSSDIEQILNPNSEEDTVRNFMFQKLLESVVIEDDSQETRDAQVFIAICKSFAKDDTAFLQSHLFRQFFGELTEKNVASVAVGFVSYYDEVRRQLTHPLKDRIYTYKKNQTPPFFILKDILHAYRSNVRKLAAAPRDLTHAVFEACERRYSGVGSKVRRAIVRSVLFILLTKALFALTIEGAYETLIYGGVSWPSMALNISIPPLLMVLVGLFIRTPNRDNSERILARIESVLFDEKAKLLVPLTLTVAPGKAKPFLTTIFTILWILAFILSFGAVYYFLTFLNFNIVNKGIFIFFLTIVSFLAYRISQMAGEYHFETKEGLMGPIVDFLFMPIIRVGRQLTEGIAQLNLLLFILDFIIETPFKGMFAFFEQWFLFLHTKREELG